MEIANDYNGATERPYCMLMGRAGNEELLREVIHTDWLDLAIVPYIARIADGRIAEMLISRKQAEAWGMDAEKLVAAAMRNTLRKDTVEMVALLDVLKQLSREIIASVQDTQEEDDMEMLLDAIKLFVDGGVLEEEWGDRPMLYVATNGKRYYGATVILDKDFLAMAAERIGGSYYILPSSIHEVMLLSCGGDAALPLSELAQMVSEINATKVAPEDVLSNTVYRYDSLSRRVEIAQVGIADGNGSDMEEEDEDDY